MKEYTIPYGRARKELTFHLEEERVLFHAFPGAGFTVPDEAALIKSAFDNPIGTDRLENLVRPDMKIMILVDDITRPTPKKTLLRETIARLKKRNVPDGNITIMIGLGTHRQLTQAELDHHFGAELLRTHRFLNLDYKDSDRFVSVGQSRSGTPIEVSRAVLEADFRIALGNIVPHIAAGWGGGAKMIQPGVCSERTTEVTHLKACTIQNVLDVCGNAENPVRLEMEEITAQIGLEFIANTVLDTQKNLLGLFCGHFIHAHRAGVELAKQVMCPAIPGQADILIASAYPCEIDFWQGVKPFIYAQYGVKEGGVLIFVIEAGEGLCGNSPHHADTLRRFLPMSYDDQLAALDRGEISDIVGINVPLFHAKIRDRVTTICVSDGFTKEDKERLGFLHAETIDEAIQMAHGLQGEAASVGIIPYCGESLVVAIQA